VHILMWGLDMAGHTVLVLKYFWPGEKVPGVELLRSCRVITLGSHSACLNHPIGKG